uniref:Uncharacterized protein n=1 Tax=Lepeophtheirus salmonis TaxID=72036 RepID=A0A0K2TJ64_LEPSM
MYTDNDSQDQKSLSLTLTLRLTYTINDPSITSDEIQGVKQLFSRDQKACELDIPINGKDRWMLIHISNCYIREIHPNDHE